MYINARVCSKTLEKTDEVMTIVFTSATYIAMGLCLFRCADK